MSLAFLSSGIPRRTLAIAGAVALALPATAGFAAAPDDDPSSRFAAAPSHGAVDSSFTAASIGADGRVTVVIEMEGDPVAVVEAEKDGDLAPSEREAVKDELKSAQDEISGEIADKGGDGKTVIKHINLWIFCNCSGNGKPLLLSAGNIASALCNRTLIPILFAVNKLCCLRNLRCFPDLLI